MNVGEFFVDESGQLTLKFYKGMEETLWEGMFIGHFRVQKLSRSKRSKVQDLSCEKKLFVCMRIKKIIFVSMALHLASF